MHRKHMLVFLFSLLIAILGSVLYLKARLTGNPVPLYVSGLLAYGGVFILFTLIDSAARAYKKKYRGK